MKNPKKKMVGKKKVRALKTPSSHHGADHSLQIKRLNKIGGQIQGIRKMIEEKRYCPDILMQTRAVCSAIRSLEASILESHLRHCVQGALAAKEEKASYDKIEELMDIFKKNL
jgi:DNA-binding FrmR family transcriptional regulator